MVRRFKLNSRRRAPPPGPFLSAQQTHSLRIRLHFPRRSPPNAKLLSPEGPKSSLFSPVACKERNFRPLVFNYLQTFVHFLQKSETLSPFFSATSTLFARIPGSRGICLPGARPRVPVRHQMALDPLVSELWSPAIMSIFGHIVTSPFPARNLIARPIILWRRDTEPFHSVVGVYFGSQGLQF
jgi:hypothetical protein